MNQCQNLQTRHHEWKYRGEINKVQGVYLSFKNRNTTREQTFSSPGKKTKKLYYPFGIFCQCYVVAQVKCTRENCHHYYVHSSHIEDGFCGMWLRARENGCCAADTDRNTCVQLSLHVLKFLIFSLNQMLKHKLQTQAKDKILPNVT